MKTPPPRIDASTFRRKIPHVLLRLSLLSILFVLTSPLRGQSEPVHMRPEFSLTFPLAQSGRDVTVKFPILVNPTTVLKPGMVLRVMYILNSANPDGSTDLVLAQKGTLEQSYARDPAASLEKANSNMSPEAVHEVEGYRRTIWEVPNNFILAMAQYPTDAMHLIYSPTGKNQDLHDERFSFFDGLLVGLPDGKVTVLAVGKAEQGGEGGTQGRRRNHFRRRSFHAKRPHHLRHRLCRRQKSGQGK